VVLVQSSAFLACIQIRQRATLRIRNAGEHETATCIAIAPLVPQRVYTVCSICVAYRNRAGGYFGL